MTVSLLAVGVVLTQGDLIAALDIVRDVDPGLMLIALGLVVVQVTFVSQRWRLLLPDSDGEPPGLLEVEQVVLVGYLGNLALPGRLGEVIRAFLMARRNNLGLPEVLGSIVLERIIDISILALLCFGLVAIGGMAEWMLWVTGVAAVFGLMTMVLVVTIGLDAPIVWIRGRLPVRAHRVDPVLATVERVASGASGNLRRGRIAVATGLTVIISLLEGAIFWVVALSLGLTLDPASAFVIAAVTILATAIPSAPGYVGTFHAAAVAAGVTLGLVATPALAFAILAHAVTVAPLAIGGGLAALSLGTRLRSLADEARRAEESATA